ncbi:MAG TPA: methylenetetrahydrofolate reductase [Xanthobacteraceae bacterium]|nr:methylenetetrahydrofolate reductase [Xanthobacteraceae bacterium]
MPGFSQRAKPQKFRDKLAAGQFVITAEITPPVSCAREDLVSLARPLVGSADAVNVTDGAGAQPHISAITAAAIVAAEGIEPIVQFVCRDKNRIALQSDLMAAAALGLRNILVLRGDDPSAGDQPDAKSVFDLTPTALMQTARTLSERGELPGGRKVKGKADFFIGAADMPIDPPAGWKPAGLIAKMNAGAEFIQTQFCMDADLIARYMRALADHGVAGKLHFLVGIAALKSARSAHWMRERLFGTVIPDRVIERMERAADPVAEGRRIALELIERYASIKGISGVHIMGPTNGDTIPTIISQVRQAA